MRTRKIVLLSLLAAQAVVLHYIEGFIPTPAPGIKLGLSNIMVLTSIVLFGFKEGLAVVIVRSFLGSLLSGSPTAIAYSLAGGIASLVIMYTLYSRFKNKLSLIGISTAGAIVHVIAQLIVASLIFGTFAILSTYLPILLVSSLLSGFFTGLSSMFTVKYTKKFCKYNKQ